MSVYASLQVRPIVDPNEGEKTDCDRTNYTVGYILWDAGQRELLLTCN